MHETQLHPDRTGSEDELLPIPELMRQLAQHRKAYRGTCPAPRRGGRICGNPIYGYANKRYCSPYCILAAFRQRHADDGARDTGPEPEA